MDPVFFLMILISVFIVGSFIMDLYLVETYGEHDEYEVVPIEYFNYEWFIMCQLINLEPYYDCPESVDGYFDVSGEEWMIFTLDDTEFPDPVNEWVYGFAVYNDDSTKQIPTDSPLNLCAFFPDFNGTDTCNLNYMVIGKNTQPTCYSPYPCTSVFEHELKHLKCKCDWHKGLEAKSQVIII